MFFWIALFLKMQFPGFCQSTEFIDTNALTETKIKLNGYVRGASYFGGEIYEFTNIFSEVRFNAEARFDQGNLKADVRMRTGSEFEERFNDFEIKELYGSFQNERAHLSIGNQIIEWGRTDGYNPTNYLSPKNYFFLTDDMDDQLLSNFMVRLKYSINPAIDLDFILSPVYRPSQYRFDLIQIGQNIQFAEFAQPSLQFKNMGFACRLNADYPIAGFSISYFNGYSTFHGFNNKETLFEPANGALSILNEPKPFRKQAIGIDFAIPTSFMIIRGETAYNLPTDKEKGMYIPNEDIYYVMGVEKEIMGFRWILQYIGRFIPHFESLSAPNALHYDMNNPIEQIKFVLDMTDYEMSAFNRKLFGQQYEFGHAVSLFISKSFAFDLVKAELAGMYDFQTEEWMLRPKVSWQINDRIRIGIGGCYLNGPEKSLFNYSSGIMNGLSVDFRVYF